MKKKLSYEPPRNIVIHRADQIPTRPVEEVIPGILYRRKVTELAGPPGSGKGTIEAALAARVSRGGSHPSWPDPTPNKRGRVLILSASEDDPEDTLSAKLLAADADMSQIFVLREINSLGRRLVPNVLPTDVGAIHDFMQRNGSGFSLLIVDPITQFIPGDSMSQSNVLKAMDELAAASVQLDLASLAVHHVVKSAKGRDPLGRVAGPLAYGGKPRSVWVTTDNHRDGDQALVNVKASLSAPVGGWAYRIELKVHANEFGPVRAPVIRWGQRFEGRATEIMEQIERAPMKQGNAVLQAITFLLRLLQHGPVSYPEIQQKALAAGISGGTLARAKKELGVECRKQAGMKYGSYVWSLNVAGRAPQ